MTTTLDKNSRSKAVEKLFEYKNQKEKEEMELKIKQVTFPEAIEFNFDELKQEITERTSAYVNLIYDDSQIREAKRDVANLRKFTKALSDERIRVKKDLLKPYEDFEKKINELTGIVNAAIRNIDSQIKQSEEQKKKEKYAQIKAYWFELVGADRIPAGTSFTQLFDNRWLNASVSLKSVCDEMNSKVEQIEKDLASLSNLPEFAFEAIEVYKSTLDMNKAISEGMRLAEIQKRKAEAERLRAEQEAELAKMKPTDPEPPATPPTEVKENREWLGFKAYLTVNDAQALAGLFAARGIPYEPIAI